MSGELPVRRQELEPLFLGLNEQQLVERILVRDSHVRRFSGAELLVVESEHAAAESGILEGGQHRFDLVRRYVPKSQTAAVGVPLFPVDALLRRLGQPTSSTAGSPFLVMTTRSPF